MSFFKKLFGKHKEKNGVRKDIALTPEQFFDTDSIKTLIDKYKRSTILLRPHKSETVIDQQESKFGGMPSFTGFDTYPCCDTCKTPLNFVFQLYKEDFPTFYFPNNANLFQLFRCPNYDCSGGYSEQYDHKMFHYYLVATAHNKILPKPKHNLSDAEKEVPDCYLKPQVAQDYPNFDDFEGDDFRIRNSGILIHEKFS